MIYIAVENKLHHGGLLYPAAPQRRVRLASHQHLPQCLVFLTEDDSIPPLPELPAAQEDQGLEVHAWNVTWAGQLIKCCGGDVLR